MAEREIGIGVIGTGFGVRVQIPVFASLPGVRVLAVCSAGAERAAAVAERFGIPHALTSPEDLAAVDGVDLVSVTTRPDLHRPGVLAALRADRHVLCEKPFALDASEAAEMLGEARARDVLHLVNFEFRCTPARARMRALVEEGYLGELRQVQMVSASDFLTSYDGHNAPWWFRRESGGGWLGAAASHDIDAIRFLFCPAAGEIERVGAQLGTFVTRPRVRGAEEPVDSEVDDTCQLLLRFESGALGALLTGAAAGAATPGGRIEAYGSEGTLVLAGDRLRGARRGDGKLAEIPVPAPEVPGRVRDPHYVPFALWAQRIVAALRSGEPLRPDFEDGLRSQQVIDAARAASAEGRFVPVGASRG